MSHLGIAKDARVLNDGLTRSDELLPLQDPPPGQEGLRLLELLEEGDLLQLFEQPELDLPLVQGHEPDSSMMELVDSVAAEDLFEVIKRVL